MQIFKNNFPILLKQISDPPEKLYFKGNLEALDKTCISVVGSRKNTDYGEEIVHQLISGLSLLDIAIVSGLAKGIDSIAHQSALENGLTTIAVLGSGIDYIYPEKNYRLADDIIENNGLILSEYPGKTQPINYQFPERNRIISGLSIATIIIEAAEQSGALITARFALNQNRDVFVIPGDVDRETSRGTLALLQKGLAYPISGAQDLLAFLRQQNHLFEIDKKSPAKTEISTDLQKVKKDFSLKLNPEQNGVFSLLSKRKGLDLDQIVQKSKLPIFQLLSVISSLEILQLIEQKRGLYYSKI